MVSPILRCLLFSIFVNDTPNVVVHVQINMYADDTELHVVVRIYKMFRMIFSLTSVGYRISCRQTQLDCNEMFQNL